MISPLITSLVLVALLINTGSALSIIGKSPGTWDLNGCPVYLLHCAIWCPYGPAKDENNCPLPCGCSPAPTTEQPTTTGSCPTLSPGTTGTCEEACGPDGGCQAGYLCCSNGCGHTCQKAVTNPGAGRCPTRPSWLAGTCVEACGGGCESGYLCCSNGCGHTCQRAV